MEHRCVPEPVLDMVKMQLVFAKRATATVVPRPHLAAGID